MRPTISALIGVLCLTASASAKETKPLGPHEAAFVAAADGSAVNDTAIQPVAVVLRPVVDLGGCLTVGDPAIDIVDPKFKRVRPGRYAVVGARWFDRWDNTYDYGGVSPSPGRWLTVTVAPSVVTDLGVFPLTTPYSHRYLVGTPKPPPGGAWPQTVDLGANRVVAAVWSYETIVKGDSCGPIIAPSAK